MKTIELLIPTKQFSNIKFTVEYQTEAELDKEIIRLWRKYWNFFENVDLRDKLDKKQKAQDSFINELGDGTELSEQVS